MKISNKTKVLIILFFVILLLLFLIPLPIHISKNLPLKAIDSSGNLLEKGTLIVTGTKFNYLIKQDWIKLKIIPEISNKANLLNGVEYIEVDSFNINPFLETLDLLSFVGWAIDKNIDGHFYYFLTSKDLNTWVFHGENDGIIYCTTCESPVLEKLLEFVIIQ